MTSTPPTFTTTGSSSPVAALAPPLPTTSSDRVLGILAIVFGIASIVLGFQVLFAIAGLILGVLSLRRESTARGLAVTGIVTSSVTLAGTLFGSAIALAVLPLVALAGLWN